MVLVMACQGIFTHDGLQKILNPCVSQSGEQMPSLLSECNPLPEVWGTGSLERGGWGRERLLTAEENSDLKPRHLEEKLPAETL